MPPTQTTDDDASTDNEVTYPHEGDPAIDTADEVFVDSATKALDDEPFHITVGERAGVLERIELEREPGESYADWIRQAAERRLEGVGHTPLGPGGGVEAMGFPRDYTPDNDTPDEQLDEALSTADPANWIPVNIEFPARDLEAFDRAEAEIERTVADWIRGAVVIRLATVEDDLEQTPAVDVAVPEPIVERARLKAEYKADRLESASYRGALDDALLGLVQPQFVWVTEDGEPIRDED